MDNAYYEDLAGRLYGLVMRLAGPSRKVVAADRVGLELEPRHRRVSRRRPPRRSSRHGVRRLSGRGIALRTGGAGQ
jgi:hypothetical protein